MRLFSPGDGLREIGRGELGEALADGDSAVWIDLLRPRESRAGS
ncbi:hypothetical protein [Rubrobacter aplysinae]|nr:hypothetical protein [Rubrobacter aplysinae]